MTPEIYAQAQRQGGLVTRAQLVALGVTDDVIAAQLAAERWQRVHRGVLATFTGPLDERARLWGALLVGGAGAALSHDSAAHLHGLCDEPDSVHVVVTVNGRRVAPPGVVLHRSRAERSVSGRPPRTDVTDTLVDLASAGLTGDRLAAVVARAVQRRLVRPEQVLDVLDRRGRRGLRGAGELAGLVTDAGEGAHSALELRFLRDVERAHGLPTGRRQHRARHGGRTTYRDVVYEVGGVVVVVELDGRLGHDGLRDRFRDLRRDADARRAGEVTLRYGWWDVSGSPCEVAQQVVAVLGVSMRPCPRCGGSLGLQAR